MNRLTRCHALAYMVLALLVAAALRLPELPQSPPGVHYDEAAYGLNAGDIGLRGERPIFIPSFTGREPLYLYLAGGMARVLGNTLFALRLTSAFVGLLTIAATYWLGREMLADRRIALLAAALLAVSFWHVLFSRLGFRAISQPLLQALAVAALFRGLRGGRWRWLGLAGLLIGLSAYTYLAARLFPILLAFALLPLLLDRDRRRVRLRQIAWVALVAFLTALPLLVYFYLHPDAFWVRIGQVAPGAESLSLSQSLLRSLGMFFLKGDPYLRFNLPGRPIFDFVTGSLFLVGWLLCLWRYRRLPYDWQRAAVLLLLLAPLVMLLPTALAVSEIVPSNLRAIGLIPFIFFLPPIGLIALLAGWMTTEIGRQPWVVYGLQRTRDAVSAHAAGPVALSLALFVVVYFVCFGVGIRYMLKLASAGPAPDAHPHPHPDDRPSYGPGSVVPAAIAAASAPQAMARHGHRES